LTLWCDLQVSWLQPHRLKRSAIIPSVLSFEVHRDLTALIASVEGVAAAAEERVAASEIELRVAATLEIADRLEAIVETRFAKLRRHLWFLRLRHHEGKPHLADGDITDLRKHDLPAVVEAVETWSARLLDPGLAAVVGDLWKNQQYDAAVRAGFVYVEERMRALAAVEPADGVVGRRLVHRLLPVKGEMPGEWTDRGLLGHLTENEESGARDLLSGALVLFRNATAHRQVGYAREEADDVLHLVSLSLRLLAKYDSNISTDGGQNKAASPATSSP
jgi:hypothetical protein